MKTQADGVSKISQTTNEAERVGSVFMHLDRNSTLSILSGWAIDLTLSIATSSTMTAQETCSFFALSNNWLY